MPYKINFCDINIELAHTDQRKYRKYEERIKTVIMWDVMLCTVVSLL